MPGLMPLDGTEDEGMMVNECEALYGSRLELRRLTSSNLRHVGLQLWAGALVPYTLHSALEAVTRALRIEEQCVFKEVGWVHVIRLDP